MRYRSISSVASDLCTIHLGDPAGRKMGLAVRALRNSLDELNMSVLPNVVSKHFEIGDDYTILMPGDTIQVSKVGVVLDNGRVRFMGRIDEIRRATETVCCTCTEETHDTPGTVCSACTVYGVPFGISGKGELYGYRLPEFPNGTFRYNKAENRIEFGTGYDVVPGDRILVEYLAAVTGAAYDLIPSELANAIMYHAAMQMNLGNRPGLSANYMNEFRRSYDIYKRIALSYDIADLAGALRGQSMSAPKF